MHRLLQTRLPTYPHLHRRRRSEYIFPLIMALLPILIAVASSLILEISIQISLGFGLFIALLVIIRYLYASTNFRLHLIRKRSWMKKSGKPFWKSLRWLFRITPPEKRLSNLKVVQRLEARAANKKHSYLWLLDAIALMGYVLYTLFVSQVAWDASNIAAISGLILIASLGGVFHYSLLVDEVVQYLKWGDHTTIFIILTTLWILLVGWPFIVNRIFIMVCLLLAVYTLYLAVFAYLRMNIGESVVNQVLHGFIQDVMRGEETDELYKKIVSQITERLRYGQTSLLKPHINPDTACVDGLEIAYQSESGNGGAPSHIGQVVPLSGSLTGRAWRSRQTVAWNDVRNASGQFYQLGEYDQRTRSEIAVPILHENQVFSVLDIQSPRPGVFRQTDLDHLEIIAEMIGARQAELQALEQSKELISKLWELRAISEELLFRRFANYALNTLKADLVIYFPLSYSWMPVKEPLYEGDYPPAPMSADRMTDLNSPLIRLIQQWEPVFENRITDQSQLMHPERDVSSSFPRRFGFVSGCFLPVGLKRDRMAALFLNFREEMRFDPLHRFLLLNFAMVFGASLARLRYREFFYRGFGRPDLGLHALKGRFGLKTGASPVGQLLLHRYFSNPTSYTENDLRNYMRNINDFIDQVTLADAALPPDFWDLGNTLEKALQDYQNGLPPRSGSRQAFVELAIDPRIERESSWFKTVLFQVITEAINNAVTHGNASLVTVCVKRKNSQTDVRVVNNGDPLPDVIHQERSARGIYSLLEKLKQELGAVGEVTPGEGNLGCVVEVCIPCLPDETI
jgi:hypothetical protein